MKVKKPKPSVSRNWLYFSQKTSVPSCKKFSLRNYCFVIFHSAWKAKSLVFSFVLFWASFVLGRLSQRLETSGKISLCHFSPEKKKVKLCIFVKSKIIFCTKKKGSKKCFSWRQRKFVKEKRQQKLFYLCKNTSEELTEKKWKR